MKIRITKSGIIGTLFLITLLFPTSIHQYSQSRVMLYLGYIVFDMVCIYILFIKKIDVDKNITYAIIILLLLLGFTIYSKMVNDIEAYVLGEVPRYCSVLIACNTPIEKISARKSWDIGFCIVVLIIGIFSIGSILRINPLNNILTTFYVEHSDMFLYWMLAVNKPVTFFTSHSIAAYIYSLIIVVLYLRNKLYKRSLINIVAIVFYIFFIFKLDSNSSKMILVILAFIFAYGEWKDLGKVRKIVAFMIISVVTIYAAFAIDYSQVIGRVLGTKFNGLISRYSTMGVMGNSITYIISGGVPSGLTNIYYDGMALYYRDSMWLVNYLRGGVLLVIAYEILIFHFLKKSLNAFYEIIFGMIAMFDVGFTMSFQFRFLAILLFIIPYINLMYKKNEEDNANEKYVAKRYV